MRHERTGDVGQHVEEADAQRACAKSLQRLDVGHAAFMQIGRAGHQRECGRECQPDSQRQRHDAGSEDRREHQCEQNAGHRPQQVHQPDQHRFERTADSGRDERRQNASHNGNGQGKCRHGQAHAKAGDQSRQDVAPEVVGAEQVRVGRRMVAQTQQLRGGIKIERPRTGNP